MFSLNFTERFISNNVVFLLPYLFLQISLEECLLNTFLGHALRGYSSSLQKCSFFMDNCVILKSQGRFYTAVTDLRLFVLTEKDFVLVSTLDEH